MNNPKTMKFFRLKFQEILRACINKKLIDNIFSALIMHCHYGLPKSRYTQLC
jgi:hypothetical protein